MNVIYSVELIMHVKHLLGILILVLLLLLMDPVSDYAFNYGFR